MYNQPITQRVKTSAKSACPKCGKKACTCKKGDCGCGE